MIGIYGGTFDPIHFGHLHLATEIMNIRHLEEVWFCPVSISPHKLDQVPPTPVVHRLKMLELALADYPNFRILDVEAKREGPSYTIDTLRAVVAEEAKNSSFSTPPSSFPREFCLILGDDAVQSFCRWHQPEEIAKLVPIYIGRRLKNPIEFEKLNGDPSLCEALEHGMTPTTLVEVSGTEIRRRLSEGLDCSEFVPMKVLDYIYAHRLYLKH